MLQSDLVGVFIGATSGIGEATLKKIAAYSHKPRLYFVGRSQDAADRITAECKVLNPAGEYIFIQADVSLIRVVDQVCEEIKAREKFLNILFLSAGVPSMDRAETSEGLHLLASLNYYSRLRFVTNLLPLLQVAPIFRRVVTVGGGSKEGPIDLSDFQAFRVPLPQLRGHLTTLITLGLEAVAKTAPDVSFVHNYPGTVKTRFNNYMSEEMLKASVMVPIDESGDRHVYLATSSIFPALEGGEDGVRIGAEDHVTLGTNGAVGSGLYSVGADCESASQEVRELLAELRTNGMVEQVWSHTQGEYKRICS